MTIHLIFTPSPHSILNPDIRWFPADEVLRQKRIIAIATRPATGTPSI